MSISVFLTLSVTVVEWLALMISFSYRLTGSGWALAELSDEKIGARIPASYLCDALRDFVDAVASVFSAESAECFWEEEPGEVRWKFRRAGDRLNVQVLWDEDQKFYGDDDLLHFSSQVNAALLKLLDDWGADGYLKKWKYPFPHEAHRKLEQAVALEQRRRASASR
jgi:hypothetical protein